MCYNIPSSKTETVKKEITKMKFEYKTISLDSIENIKKAERLKANGWRIIRTGLFMIQFERAINKKAVA